MKLNRKHVDILNTLAEHSVVFYTLIGATIGMLLFFLGLIAEAEAQSNILASGGVEALKAYELSVHAMEYKSMFSYLWAGISDQLGSYGGFTQCWGVALICVSPIAAFLFQRAAKLCWKSTLAYQVEEMFA